MNISINKGLCSNAAKPQQHQVLVTVTTFGMHAREPIELLALSYTDHANGKQTRVQTFVNRPNAGPSAFTLGTKTIDNEVRAIVQKNHTQSLLFLNGKKPNVGICTDMLDAQSRHPNGCGLPQDPGFLKFTDTVRMMAETLQAQRTVQEASQYPGVMMG